MSKPVSLIAPVAPFRGGIARHSEAVANALAAQGDVALAVESFASLYPRWLYPGESDRDLASEHNLPCPAPFDLATLDPLSWRRVADRIAARGGLAIIPAWTFFTAPMLGWIARRLTKRGMAVAMIVHNAADHEASGWKSRLSNWQLAGADCFVTHSEELARQLRAQGHRQPVTVIDHPAYSDFPAPQGTMPRDKALELLCFGLVRGYKGVDIAMRALANSGLEDVRLTIAGEIWDGRAEIEALARSPQLEGKIELVDRYVSDAEAADLFARCDALLAPYRSVTGSGVLAMARYYRRPVAASDLPALAAQVEPDRTGWLFPAGDEAALAGLLRETVTRAACAAMAEALESAAAADTGWGGYADALLALVDSLPRPSA